MIASKGDLLKFPPLAKAGGVTGETPLEEVLAAPAGNLAAAPFGVPLEPRGAPGMKDEPAVGDMA